MKREPLEVCEISVIHEDVLARVKEKMPNEEPVYEVSELFKVFGDSTRARIICALNIEESRKQGRVVYYSLDDAHIGQIFAMAFDHVMEEMEG